MLPTTKRLRRFQLINCRYAALAFALIPSPALAQWPATHYLRFDLDEKAAPADFLPVPPKLLLGGQLGTDDLAQVPEVQFQEPFVGKIVAANDRDPKIRIPTALQMAKINILNKRKQDLFLETLLHHRADLSGLPFLRGNSAQVKETERADFKEEFQWVQEHHNTIGFWQSLDSYCEQKHEKKTAPARDRFTVAALMQILAPKIAEPTELTERLTTLGKNADQEVTQALTRLAVFSTDKKVRQAALKALQNRQPDPATAILLKGLRYPWPSVAQNSAEAIVQLKRAELVKELIKMLEEPDPRAPVDSEAKGKKVPMIRELVRINHPRSCLLCHPPGNTPDILSFEKIGKWQEVEAGVWTTQTLYPIRDFDIVLGGIPVPGQQFPGTSYDRFLTDLVVRVDVTYLRPDFSMLHRVKDADPWPEMQRFDYVVRNRALAKDEAKAYVKGFADPAAVSPYRQVALDALRRLTGKDAGTTAEQWRAVIGS